jgi:hypothetical protein
MTQLTVRVIQIIETSFPIHGFETAVVAETPARSPTQKMTTLNLTNQCLSGAL